MLREIKHICGHIETYQIPRGQFARTKRFMRNAYAVSVG